jgi:predicted phage tail protein
MDSTNLKIVRVDNPFDRKRRQTFEKDYQNESLNELIPQFFPEELKVCVSINGNIVPEDQWNYIPRQGDQIVLIPIIQGGGGGGKKILGVVAMIALAVIAPGVGSAIATSMGFAAQGLAATMFSTMIMIGGGLLINSLMPSGSIQTPKLKGQDVEKSQFYGWNPVTVQEQGISIPRFYGKNKVHGNIISGRTVINADRDGQVLHILFALGMGPISGVTQTGGEYDIWVNDQPLVNFSGVSFQQRKGLLDQSVMNGFGVVDSETIVNQKVEKGSPVTHTTTGGNFDDLLIELSFPSGVFYANDKGGLDTHSIGFKVECKRTIDATWTTIKTHTLKRNKQSKFIARYSAEARGVTIENGYNYDVRVTKTTNNKTTTRWGDDLYFSLCSERIQERFTYPRTALVSLRAMASEQLTGSLRFHCYAEGSYVQVYDGASWSIEYTTNPAWVLFDILTQPVFSGDGVGTPFEVERYDGIDFDKYPNRFDIDSFKNLADFCDESVPDGDYYSISNITTASSAVVTLTEVHPFEIGDEIYFQDVVGMTEINSLKGNVTAETPYTITLDIDSSGFTAYSEGGLVSKTEKRFEFNGGFDQELSMWEAAMSVCELSRCCLIWNGSQIAVVIDKAGLPVQLFTCKNIKMDSFQEYFLPAVDRASEIEIHFKNAEKGYERVPFTIFNNDITSTSSKCSLELLGCTKQSQAWRTGQFLLRKNQLISMTASLSVDIDAIACTIGDVIAVQHNVPEWGNAGEISYVEGTDSGADYELIEIDTFDLSTFDSGDEWKVIIQHRDTDLVEEFGFSIENDKIRLDSKPEETISIGDYAAWQKVDYLYKKFKIKGITKDSDQRATLDLMEYVDAVYESDFDDMVLPEIEYTKPTIDDYKVLNLEAHERVEINDTGATIRNIEVGWEIPEDVAWEKAQVFIKFSDIDYYEFVGESNTCTFLIQNVKAETEYEIMVASIDKQGQTTSHSNSPTTTITTSAVSDIDGVLDVSIDNLQVVGGSEEIWEGRDLNVVWDDVITGNPVEDQQKIPDYWLKDYEVRIKEIYGDSAEAPDSGEYSLIRLEYVNVPRFVYSYDNNYADNLGIPLRNLRIEIKARDKFNRTSSMSFLTLSNPQCSAPSNLNLAQIRSGLFVTWSKVDDLDLVGYRLYASQTPGFTPGPTNLAYEGLDNNYTFISSLLGTWYFKLTAYDSFNEEDLSYTDANEELVNADIDEDLPFISNISWSNNSPTFDSGDPEWDENNYVEWYAEDSGNNIQVSYQGSVYDIEAGYSSNKYIYWDIASPVILQGTDDIDDVKGADKWIMCYNDNGIAYECFQQKVIHAAILEVGTVDTSQITTEAVNEVDFIISYDQLDKDSGDDWHNLIELPVLLKGGFVSYAFGYTESLYTQTALNPNLKLQFGIPYGDGDDDIVLINEWDHEGNPTMSATINDKLGIGFNINDISGWGWDNDTEVIFALRAKAWNADGGLGVNNTGVLRIAVNQIKR